MGIRDSRPFLIPNTRRCFSVQSTRCCAAGRGRRGSVPHGTRSAIGTTPFVVRSSVASGARAMTKRVSSVAMVVEREVPIAMADERGTAMLAEVRDGLSRRQKELPPKYFYDERGSELFEKITRLPEYYLTRAERGLLEEHARALVDVLRPRTLVELGAGSAAKTRILLDAMRDAGCGEVYVPVDVSAEFLSDTARQLRSEYPSLQVRPAIADIGVSLGMPDRLPRPVLFAF